MPDHQLTSLGNIVDAGYRHVAKQAYPSSPLILPDVYLKWYDLRRPDQAMASDEARAFLAQEVATGRLPISGDLGFVIHHLSGSHVHLLLVFTWRGNNEMWETTYSKDARHDPSFTLMPQTTHRGTMCVWESGIVTREHEAWKQYLHTDRSPADKQTYADYHFEGTV